MMFRSTLLAIAALPACVSSFGVAPTLFRNNVAALRMTPSSDAVTRPEALNDDHTPMQTKIGPGRELGDANTASAKTVDPIRDLAIGDDHRPMKTNNSKGLIYDVS